jgi:hypothetical protein
MTQMATIGWLYNRRAHSGKKVKRDRQNNLSLFLRSGTLFRIIPRDAQRVRSEKSNWREKVLVNKVTSEQVFRWRVSTWREA